MSAWSSARCFKERQRICAALCPRPLARTVQPFMSYEARREVYTRARSVRYWLKSAVAGFMAR